MIHANHAGSTWPRPPGVAAAVQEALAAPPPAHAALYERAHAEVAAFLGIATPSRLMFASSCTAALSLVVGDLPWQAGDVVVTSNLEHHALLRPVLKLTWERGVEHVAAPYRPGEPIDLGAVAATLRGGRVRLVAVTGASNITGEVLPVRELTALAHRYGALVLLDAAQTAGVLPLDVAALGVDLLVFAGHKGLQGPLGIGGFWAAPAVAFVCPTGSCELGHRGAVANARGAFPGFCDVGSVNLPAACGLAAGLRWLQALPPAQRTWPLAAARRLRAALRDRPFGRVLGGDGPHTATVSLQLDDDRLARAQAHFEARGIVVRAGQHCAPMALAAVEAPAGCLRISFGPANCDGDVDAVLAAIDALR